MRQACRQQGERQYYCISEKTGVERNNLRGKILTAVKAMELVFISLSTGKFRLFIYLSRLNK